MKIISGPSAGPASIQTVRWRSVSMLWVFPFGSGHTVLYRRSCGHRQASTVRYHDGWRPQSRTMPCRPKINPRCHRSPWTPPGKRYAPRKNAWNTRDPDTVSRAYTPDSVWRNRSEFIHGRDEIAAFLRRKWSRELDYRLIKELWAFHEHRIAVRFQYEWRDTVGDWFRAYGNEQWEFAANGLIAATGSQHQRRVDRRARAPVFAGRRARARMIIRA